MWIRILVLWFTLLENVSMYLLWALVFSCIILVTERAEVKVGWGKHLNSISNHLHSVDLWLVIIIIIVSVIRNFSIVWIKGSCFLLACCLKPHFLKLYFLPFSASVSSQSQYQGLSFCSLTFSSMGLQWEVFTLDGPRSLFQSCVCCATSFCLFILGGGDKWWEIKPAMLGCPKEVEGVTLTGMEDTHSKVDLYFIHLYEHLFQWAWDYSYNEYISL